MKICPEESELQPLQGRAKRALILGPEALGSDPGPTTARIHEGTLAGWPAVFLLSVLRALCCGLVSALRFWLCCPWCEVLSREVARSCQVRAGGKGSSRALGPGCAGGAEVEKPAETKVGRRNQLSDAGGKGKAVAGAEDTVRARKCLLSCYYLKTSQNPLPQLSGLR